MNADSYIFDKLPPIKEVIKITKKSESQVVVNTFSEIKEKIAKEFRFRAPNYYFHPLYKRKLWDGYIKLFNKSTNTLPTGLVPKLLKFLRSKGDWEIDMDPKISPTMVRAGLSPDGYFSKEKAIEFFNSLNLPKDVYILRDDQIDGFRHAVCYEKCLLKSATGSGKSLLAYLTLRYQLSLLPQGKPKERLALLIVPTTSLVEQMYKDFDEYSVGIDPEVFNVKRDCHRIYSGKRKQTTAPIVISTWQSIFNIDDPEWFSSFKIVIGDEAHGFKADSLVELMIDRLTNAKMRIGMTGSLDNEKANHFMIESCFGPKKTVITTRQMIDQKISSDLEIRCIELQYSDEDKAKLKKDDIDDEGNPLYFEYNEEIDFLIRHRERHEWLYELIDELRGNTLVMFIKRIHGEALFDMLSKLPGRTVFLVHGDVSVDDREEVRAYTEKNDNVVIVASVGVFSTGINIKNLQNGVLSIPTKSHNKIVQILGRILRKDGKGNLARFFDIGDNLKSAHHVNFSYRHFRKRIKTYQSENHTYELEKVDLYGR